ncbi:MAG: biosynthetic-type acetolactate synthase large subunit [Candidatus Adiutrix sp.]|jgi:acetolactate synthase-1/2/3 large subunit|nr:biosynthetic-type acetolactate synthase large subunit [Candidatus Adiutrix sp.]
MSNNTKQGPGRTGAQILVSVLEQAGVDLVFGYPGGQAIPLYDAIYDAKFKHILTRHEQGAAHAADGYARATGKVGVVVATSGPGATNLVTGLATANMDSVPLLAVTGQVPTANIGNDTFQEADIYGISMPITKYNYLVTRAEKLPQILAEALYLAQTGRPGPILVDVPKDIQVAVLAPPELAPVSIPGYNPEPAIQSSQVEALVEALRQSRRPLAYLGGGVTVSGAEKELFRLLTENDIPAVSTLMAKGVFPDDHPLALGLPGMHGAKYSNLAIYESDLILCLGARFDDRVAGNVRRFAPRARMVHVDIDAAEIGKRVETHIPVVGDLKNVLIRVLDLVNPVRRPDWLHQVAELKRKHPLPIPQDDEIIKPQSVIRAISEVTDGEAIIVTDVGQHQMWAAQLIVSKKPRRFLSSGGLGTMGFGLPAAVGAQFGRPDLPVLLIAGDGGFQMNIQELATVREHNLPIKMVVVNNGCLGMVRQWQQFFFQRRYSSTIWNYMPDFVKICAGYDLPARRVTEPREVRGAIEAMMAAPGPQFLEFKVAPEENVLPMIPAGGGQTEFYDV